MSKSNYKSTTKTGFTTIQVKTEIRDFIKYKMAKGLVNGKKLSVSDVLQKAIELAFPKDMKAFSKFKESGDD